MWCIITTDYHTYSYNCNYDEEGPVYENALVTDDIDLVS